MKIYDYENKDTVWSKTLENSKIDFFQVFHFALYFNFHSDNFLSKMWSFEVHYVGVAQLMDEWEVR